MWLLIIFSESFAWSLLTITQIQTLNSHLGLSYPQLYHKEISNQQHGWHFNIVLYLYFKPQMFSVNSALTTCGADHVHTFLVSIMLRIHAYLVQWTSSRYNYTHSLTCVLLFVTWQLMHVAADLCTQAVNDLIQGLGAGGVHADEELVLVLVHPRRTGLDVRQVDALLLRATKTKKKKETLVRPEWIFV